MVLKQYRRLGVRIGSQVIRIHTSWSGPFNGPGEGGPRNVPVVERPGGLAACPILLVPEIFFL